MDFHNHFPLRVAGERDWLDVRIDHRPLTCPVAAHFVASVDMTAFQAICPNDILVHGCEHRLHVTSVEAVVNTFKEVHFVRHSNLATSWPTLAQTPFSYTFLSPLKISDLCFTRLEPQRLVGLLSVSSATLLLFGSLRFVRHPPGIGSLLIACYRSGGLAATLASNGGPDECHGVGSAQVYLRRRALLA